MNTLPAVHFADNYLINPTNPLMICLIGAGGTGSQVLTAVARMNHALIALGHPGLMVTVWDGDIINHANLGRQLFAEAELGMYKSVALVNRINRFFGTNWKAVTKPFCNSYNGLINEAGAANIYISCVDTVVARFEIAGLLRDIEEDNRYNRSKALYWMDFGNAQYTGQVLLSTLSAIPQPSSNLFTPVAILPLITDEFKTLLENETDNSEPSCSLAEALTRQDLYINSTLANMGASLLWNLLRGGMTETRGFFINLKEFVTHPIKITPVLIRNFRRKSKKENV